MIVEATDVQLARALCDIEYGDVFDSFAVRLIDRYVFMVKRPQLILDALLISILLGLEWHDSVAEDNQNRTGSVTSNCCGEIIRSSKHCAW
ncbi:MULTISPECIES: hypothetical protein [Burkholderia]|uniref:hypothetical protein n=1 Tax=Burkholderia TaxID=32008 RepID=UPI00117D7A7D|nr:MULTISPECIES: hypothetical protein [Burkholderia]